jgi:putative ATP-binding cassette transporter
VGENTIDWSTELVNSTVWIIGVFVAVLIGTALVGWLLLRSTVWGGQFRRLAGNYFNPTREPRSWAPLLLALSLVFMTVAGVRLSVLFTYWGNDVLTSLQQGDSPASGRRCSCSCRWPGSGSSTSW